MTVSLLIALSYLALNVAKILAKALACIPCAKEPSKSSNRARRKGLSWVKMFGSELRKPWGLTDLVSDGFLRCLKPLEFRGSCNIFQRWRGELGKGKTEILRGVHIY